jgi:hypothetical protein
MSNKIKSIILRFGAAFAAGFGSTLYAEFIILPHILTISDLEKWGISVLVGAFVGGCAGLEHYLVATYPWLNPFNSIMNAEISNLQNQVDNKLNIAAPAADVVAAQAASAAAPTQVAATSPQDQQML